ncbi:hypothetical protein [Kordiimonas lacus]|uniref:MFS transporter permease n=1 Tax=Kordiimonas lacus TaxID=637679 RepID=A0A1G7CFW3_9PROT|nr:hypothetical protein [Kordiimonas lacus]SDE38151.1 hypothetical protein SAMN04488071_2784 [Kordiimonas lacus]
MFFWETLQSYELADFLMFSPAVYFRMVEAYVGSWWPLALAFVLGFSGTLWLWYQKGQDLPVWGLLAAAWVMPVPLFFLGRYAEIMTAAPAFATLFALQGALLLIARAHPVKGPAHVSPIGAWGGASLMIVALVLYPVVAMLAGRAPAAFEAVALMPDPAVPLTLGWFLLVGERRLLLWVIPFLWVVISAGILHTMGEPDYWLLPVLFLLAAVGAFLLPRSGAIKN